jgi:hypothetical protein
MTPLIKKIAMSIPSEGHTLPEAYDNHLLLSFHLGMLQERWKHENRPIQYEFGWFTVGRVLTALAREKLAENALKAGYDYIFMYDDDMLLPIDLMERLIEDVETHPEIDVVAPLAFMRNAPHYAVMYTTTEGYDTDVHQPYFFNNFVKNYPKDTLVECDAVGFGAVLIKVDMMKKLKPPYFFSTTGSGEDIYFCMKSRQETDARIFMDTRLKLGHLGRPPIIDEDYFEKWVKDNKHDIPEVPHKYISQEK